MLVPSSLAANAWISCCSIVVPTKGRMRTQLPTLHQDSSQRNFIMPAFNWMQWNPCQEHDSGYCSCSRIAVWSGQAFFLILTGSDFLVGLCVGGKADSVCQGEALSSCVGKLLPHEGRSESQGLSHSLTLWITCLLSCVQDACAGVRWLCSWNTISWLLTTHKLKVKHLRMPQWVMYCNRLLEGFQLLKRLPNLAVHLGLPIKINSKCFE